MERKQRETLSRQVRKVFPNAQIGGPHMIRVEVGRYIVISMYICGGRLFVNGDGLAGSSAEKGRAYAELNLGSMGEVNLTELEKTLEFIKTTVAQNAQQVLGDLK